MRPDVAKKKSDAVLRLLAAEAAEKIEDEYDELERQARDEDLPAYVEEGFRKALNVLSLEEKRKGREEKTKAGARIRGRVLKIAVIGVAVLSVSFMSLMVTVEAFRYKMFSMFIKETDQYTLIIPYGDADGQELLKDLGGHYFPEYIPDGYELTETDKSEGGRILLYFVNQEGGSIKLQQYRLEGSSIMIDNEGDGKGEFEINGGTGLWSRKDDTNIFFWTYAERGFTLITEGVAFETAEKIARSVAYRR